MRKLLPLLILVLFAAVLFGCMQNGYQSPPSQQPEAQQVTPAPVEDIAAQQLESQIPNGSDSLADLNGVLASFTS